MSQNTVLGIIGGTGLYKLDGLEGLQELNIDTPFGRPSAPVRVGRLSGQSIAFLPRHGLHHQILPSEINYRANLWALKAAGVRKVLSVSATGSLEEAIAPGSLAVVSQYFDWTKGKRAHTYFGEGIVGHISTAKPSCGALSTRVLSAGEKSGVAIHSEKTYACVEGPRLGTRAESFFLRQAGCHLVGMTNLPEAFLAREAQLCYCTLAIATDYDCWKDDPDEHVTVDQVIARYQATLQDVLKVIRTLAADGSEYAACACSSSLSGAILTPADALSPNQRKVLEFLRS